MSRVKVLTIQQPYAQLCCLGIKKVETRPMVTNHRGELYIHASQSFHRGLRSLCGKDTFRDYITSHLDLATGAIIGKVTIEACLPVEGLIAEERLAVIERKFGDYTPGRYGWMLSNPVLFETPIPAKGQQGIWYFDLKEEPKVYMPEFEPDYIGPDEKEVSRG
jgi:hypothetical protein